MSTRQTMPDKEYFELLQKDSMMLYCIDMLDLLTTAQWNEALELCKQETEFLDMEEVQ